MITIKKTLQMVAAMSVSGLVSAGTMGPIVDQVDWNGFYAGVNAGAAFDKSNVATSTVFVPGGYFVPTSIPQIAAAGLQNFSKTIFNYGLQAGYNYDMNHWLWGLEADISGMNFNQSQSVTVPYSNAPATAFTINQNIKTNWLFTARPRLGFDFGNWMAFATGGYALTDLAYNEVFTDNNSAANESAGRKTSRSGWTAGAGLEYMFAPGWSLRAQYLYADFGTQTITSSNLTTGGGVTPRPNVFTHSFSLKTQVASAAINYHF